MYVMNISSSIICPVFTNSVHFFSKKVSQSIGFCLVFSNLKFRNLVYNSTLSSLGFGCHLLSSLPQAFLKSDLLNLSEVAFSTMFKDISSGSVLLRENAWRIFSIMVIFVLTSAKIEPNVRILTFSLSYFGK